MPQDDRLEVCERARGCKKDNVLEDKVRRERILGVRSHLLDVRQEVVDEHSAGTVSYERDLGTWALSKQCAETRENVASAARRLSELERLTRLVLHRRPDPRSGVSNIEGS